MTQETLLVVVRHGTARRPETGENDFNRPLTPEGETDVKRVAEWLAETVGPCNVVVTSPAVRARQTATLLANRLLKAPAEPVLTAPIYEASRQTLIEVVTGFDHPGPVVLVGHNPGLEDLANYLLDAEDRRAVQLSPGQAVCLRLLSGWAGTGRGTARLDAEISPGAIPARPR